MNLMISFVIGFLIWCLGWALFVHYDYNNRVQRESLEFACKTLGGTYIDSTNCFTGKNLFGDK